MYKIMNLHDNLKRIFHKYFKLMVTSVIILLPITITHATTIQITKIEVIGKTPTQIYNFMFGLNKTKYTTWHPEHEDFKIVKQTKDTIGTVFFFHEQLNKLKVKYKWEVMEITQNRKIVMKAKYFIPIVLTLTFNQIPTGTLVTHNLQIGFKKTTGITDWFIQHFVLTKSKKDSQARHAVEEFKNLEKVIL